MKKKMKVLVDKREDIRREMKKEMATHSSGPGKTHGQRSLAGNSPGHPQNVVSGDKISQDSSKEPAQLGRDCTPKQAGDKSSDPSTRRDLSHPGDVNLELANAPTSPCHTILMLLMIVPCIINCLTCLSLLRSTSYNMPCQFNKDIKLRLIMENIAHP